MKKLVAFTVAVTLSSFGTQVDAAPCFLFNTQIQFAAAGPYSTYQNTSTQPVILRGMGARSHSFELLFRYPGDTNAFGTPPGAIELMTNSLFARNQGMAQAQSDMGTIQANPDGSFTFTLDPSAALQLPPPNVFTVQGPGGDAQGLGSICLLPALSALCGQTQQAPVLADFYVVPTQGTVNFAFGANTIFGQMFITGFQIDNPSVQGQYFANFNGTLQAQGEC